MKRGLDSFAYGKLNKKGWVSIWLVIGIATTV